MSFLLDSNVCIDLMRGQPQVVAKFQSVSPDDCVVSVLSVFELQSGARRSRFPERELRRVAILLEPMVRLPWDEAAAAAASRIRFELESRGTRIGAIDTLIAGHALSLDLPLVTDNIDEFCRVGGLRVLNWRP